jgi:hypothetical protein
VLLFGARWYLDRQWYVADNGGSVAIFQGMPLTVIGYDLGHPYLTFDDLPIAEVAKLPTHEDIAQGTTFGSLAGAKEHVDQIRNELATARAQERRQQREQDQGGGGG